MRPETPTDRIEHALRRQSEAISSLSRSRRTELLAMMATSLFAGISGITQTQVVKVARDILAAVEASEQKQA